MTAIQESATIGARVVNVSGRASVTLDVRRGKPVKVPLDTPADVTEPTRTSAQVCAATVSDMPSGFSTGGSNHEGSVYAIPNGTTGVLADVRDDDALYTATTHVTPGRRQPRDDINAGNGGRRRRRFPVGQDAEGGAELHPGFRPGRVESAGFSADGPAEVSQLRSGRPDRRPRHGWLGADATKETVVLSTGSTTVKKHRP